MIRPTSNTSLNENPASSTIERLGVELAREMRHRWRCGEQQPAEYFFSRRPELMEQPEAAVELIYEEYCLRQATGEEGVERDILRRFPQWAGPLRVMLDCHRRVLQSERDQPRFPAIGEHVGEFRLRAELIRGSRGRVFLATQTALADRQVVLKITPLDGSEHLSLARLQHTNIVPLYSVMDDTARNIRVLCMPYFGRATLASLLESVAAVPLTARRGQHIADAIDEQEPAPAAIPGAARQMLANVSYVQATCWIGSCIADALHFAHERGLVHLDLKPSNILLASDGQPMLLDFHLAREPIRPNGHFPENFGGTRPYMPPEQQLAIQSLQQGKAIENVVDARADIYALGAMLYESLGGRLPITGCSPPLIQVNPQVSCGLCDIVAKCLEGRPEDRYSNARDLADDLRRHLTDQPLIGVPNHSTMERWQKWRRRRPHRLGAVGMLLILVGSAAIVVASFWSNMHDRQEQAALALYDGVRQLQSGQSGVEAIKTFERGVGLLEHLPFQQDLQQQLREQLATAKALHFADQLHDLADKIRVLYGSSDAIPPVRQKELTSQCQAFWQKRQTIFDLLRHSKAPTPESAADLQDIAIFAASGMARDEAVRLLDEIEAAFGPSAIVEHQRQRLQISNLKSKTSTSTSEPSYPNPHTAWEHYALGRAMLASGDLERAEGELDAALKLDPAGRWPNFYYGLCSYRMGRHEDAIAAFSVCIGTAPNVAGCFYNRALAYAALGRTEQAMQDYDLALQIDPAHAAAALNRGMLHFEQERLGAAIADLNTALDHGADAATVHYNLALIHMKGNDPTSALNDVERALKFNPIHENSRQLQEILNRE